jgi:hypothetical protein
MLTDIGEFIVGAHLQLIEGCDVVDYNVRAPGGGLEGLGELDVLGLNFATDTVFLCEVTTHIRGILYKNNKETVARIGKKHERQKAYARRYLSNFKNFRYMLWSPVVPVGYVTKGLSDFTSLELIINGEYKKRIEELRELASNTTHDARNPFFRMLQIMEHMRD